MQNASIGAQPIPPDPGARQTAAADHADKTDCRILKYREQIEYDILVDDQHILVQIYLVFRICCECPLIIAGAHGCGAANWDIVDLHAARDMERL